jgi:D-sedoheptulose 7-phosphate isomerase
MNAEQIKNHFIEAQQTLNHFLSDTANFDAIASAGALMSDAVNNGGKIFSCGNGGSLCDAMHFAEEMTGRYRENRKALPAIALSDASHMSCVSNDYGYSHVFERMIDALGQRNDVLLAISTSGNSENVILAIEAARKKGMRVVGLTGKDGGKMADLVDVEIRAPYSKYADRAQEIHIKVIHALIDYIEHHCTKVL